MVVSMFSKTRKDLNYACVWVMLEEILVEAQIVTDVQIVRVNWV